MVSSSREILNGRAGRRSQLLCPQCHHQLCLGCIAHSRAREEPTPFPQCRSQLSTSSLSSTWGECRASLDGIAVSLFANCIRRQYVGSFECFKLRASSKYQSRTHVSKGSGDRNIEIYFIKTFDLHPQRNIHMD